VDRRAAGILAGVPFGARMAAVLGFVVLAVVACGNAPVAVSPSVTPGSPLSFHSASPASRASSPGSQIVIQGLGNDGGGIDIGGIHMDRAPGPGFFGCLARHGVTMTNLRNQGKHRPTPAEISAFTACSTPIRLRMAR
jgi:hypothetical protein